MFQGLRLSGKENQKLWDGTRLYPIVTSNTLLQSNNVKHYVDSFMGISSLSQERYKNLYVPVLNNFADYVQKLPEQNNADYAQLEGMLLHGIERSHTALCVYREYLAKAGVLGNPPSEMQALWSYCVFSAALLQDIANLSLDFEIGLFDEGREQVALWNPLRGPMKNFGKFYNFITTKSGKLGVYKWLNPVMAAECCMPSEGMEWLKVNQDVFHIWLALINGEYRTIVGSGLIARCIPLAEEQLKALSMEELLALKELTKERLRKNSYFDMDMSEREKQAAAMSRSGRFGKPGKEKGLSIDVVDTKFKDASAIFLAWLAHEISNGQLLDKVNRIQKGLFVQDSVLLDFHEYCERNILMKEGVAYKHWKALIGQLSRIGVAMQDHSGRTLLTAQNKAGKKVQGIIMTNPEQYLNAATLNKLKTTTTLSLQTPVQTVSAQNTTTAPQLQTKV